jgi:hypothetical protein
MQNIPGGGLIDVRNVFIVVSLSIRFDNLLGWKRFTRRFTRRFCRFTVINIRLDDSLALDLSFG